MATQPQDPTPAAGAPAPEPSSEAAVRLSRRRFGKAGLAGAGVVLTLHSQPGMATGTQMACFAPSGLISGKIQSKNTVVRSCQGRSPGYWKNKDQRFWPSGCQQGAKFTSIFPSGSSNVPYGTYTLMEMLNCSDNVDKYNVGAHMVAAYLNAKSVSNYVVPMATLQAMWLEYFSARKFTPTAGKSWDGPQIVRYLKGTFDNLRHDPQDPLGWD